MFCCLLVYFSINVLKKCFDGHHFQDVLFFHFKYSIHHVIKSPFSRIISLQLNNRTTNPLTWQNWAILTIEAIILYGSSLTCKNRKTKTNFILFCGSILGRPNDVPPPAFSSPPLLSAPLWGTVQLLSGVGQSWHLIRQKPHTISHFGKRTNKQTSSSTCTDALSPKLSLNPLWTD